MGLICDNCDKFILTSCRKVTSFAVAKTELRAALLDLQLAAPLATNIVGIVSEGDSMEAITNIKNAINGDSDGTSLKSIASI